ncbi:MAG: hypothetical protein Q9220_005137 [cf. Caloplaca sp. 1 TL-2023]
MAPITVDPLVSRADSDSDSPSSLPDPRSSMTSPDLSRSGSTSPACPELSNEVATLSNKLIRAINHQTDLDDILAETRQELDAAQRCIRQLEATTREHNTRLTNGDLVPKSEVERQKVLLLENLADEQKQRGVMEKDKRGMEQELESLTTALFEEANQMVAAARKEREAADRRNDQLRAQLNDTELLLTSHQEQLAELKAVMHRMNFDREEAKFHTSASTAPSTPAMHTHESLARGFNTLHLSPIPAAMDDIVPAPPTSFAHILYPVVRTDLQAYEDFHTLLSLSRKSSPSSRVSSGSFNTLNVSALSHLPGRDQQHLNSRLSSTGSTSSLSTSVTWPSSPAAPSSTNSSVSSRDMSLSGLALKETRFYKRILTEDIEPTLRLDTAPGLSWLARRTVINSMSEGSLVVEPMPVAIKHNIFACSLCGENRQDEEHARSHRFRTSENDNAQRYPLCSFCLTRVRASCDFLGFLRMLRDGHWRADDGEAEIQAWEECVRLRERMFWARIGGGVVPVSLRPRDPPAIPAEAEKESAVGASKSLPAAQVDSQDREELSANACTMENKTSTEHAKDLGTSDRVSQSIPEHSSAAASDQLQSELQDASLWEPQGLGIENLSTRLQDTAARDSVTIPGAFE